MLVCLTDTTLLQATSFFIILFSWITVTVSSPNSRFFVRLQVSLTASIMEHVYDLENFISLEVVHLF